MTLFRIWFSLNLDFFVASVCATDQTFFVWLAKFRANDLSLKEATCQPPIFCRKAVFEFVNF